MTARVGMMLYGWSRNDDADTRRIEAIGTDWIVCRKEDGRVSFWEFKDSDELESEIAKMAQKPEGWEP